VQDATELLEEYRPAWEVEPGWEMRAEDGRWLRVTGVFEWKSKDITKPDVVEMWLEDVSSSLVGADDLVMTRKRRNGA